MQKPVYYTSRALRGAEGRYPLMEKLTFALITASRKLRHYFQAHVIIVMTDHPLKKVMNKLEAARRLIQWAIELSEFEIRYQPRNAIKAKLQQISLQNLPQAMVTWTRWKVTKHGSSMWMGRLCYMQVESKLF